MKSPEYPHPLEGWLVERAKASDRSAFDVVTVTVWMCGDTMPAHAAWKAHERVTAFLLDVCHRRGVLTRDAQGWYRLAAGRAP